MVTPQADSLTLEGIRLAIGLVGLCSGLLTILALTLRKTVLSEKRTTEEHRSVVAAQTEQITTTSASLSKDIQILRVNLDDLMLQVSLLKSSFVKEIKGLEEIKAGFKGYFEIMREKVDQSEKRLEIVESQIEQVIYIGKQMAARIRGGGDGTSKP